MLPRQQVVDKVLEVWHHFNNGDHDRWIAMFHPDLVVHDPVGSPLKFGIEAAEKSWEAGFSLEPWTVVPGDIIVCGNIATFTASHMSTLNGIRVLLKDIEVWELADDGRFISVTAYYEPLEGTPDYFLPTEN